jgi:hypothetical protein
MATAAELRRLNEFLNPPTTGSYITDQKIRADRLAMWNNFVRRQPGYTKN